MGDKVAYLVIIFLSLAPQLVQTGVLYVTFAPAFTSKEVNAVKSHGLSCLGLSDKKSNTYVFGFKRMPRDEAINLLSKQAGVQIVQSSPPWEGNNANLVVDSPATSGSQDSIHISYEECLKSLEHKPRTKTLHRPLEWIHIPKCGTSFGAVIHGYICSWEPAPYTNPDDASRNCTYCGDRPGEGKHLGNGQWWDPKLRNLIPFSNKPWRGHTHRWADFYAPYCDWTQTPKPPYSNHFGMNGRSLNNDVLVLFREPRRRLVSSWNNNKHSYGTSNQRNHVTALLVTSSYQITEQL
eukprot:m.65665 g.65665  ORF g.65665 m.65665 type:complete len:294 (+) comp11750_c1_seq2:176-1057(+)